MADTWNPTQYNRFQHERRQPGLDLIGLVRARPRARVVDLGCGTGELTRLLHDRLGARESVGFDSSASMLAKSASHATAGLRFAVGDIADFAADGDWDVVFSNAALHWLPDHSGLFARLTHALAPQGQLAVGMPYNFDHPSHTIAAAIAREASFRAALGGWAIDHPVLPPEDYAALLHRLGYIEQHVRLQVYAHVLESRDGVLEWVKGTLLTAYQQRLPADLWAMFLDTYRQRLLPALADERPYFYPFKRVLIWGQRS